MSRPTQSKSWILANPPPNGHPTFSGSNATFEIKTESIPESLPNDHVLVKTLYLSNDPAQRTWIDHSIGEDRHYTTLVKKGAVMRARALVEVVESNASSLQKGTVGTATVGWRDYAVIPAKDVTQIPRVEGLDITVNLGAFGTTGLTAYVGLVIESKAKKGDKVVVSGAAGATGSMAVQIAKRLVGCREVIGIAGTDEKCRWVESIGAEKCVNYKSKNFAEELNAAAKDADIYFDNVGGETLDLMLGNMKRHGHIAACGSISSYNSREPTALKNWFQVISMRICIRGFLVVDNADKYKEIIGQLVQGYKDGKIKLDKGSEHIVPSSFEDIPKTWLQLFEGGNQGKLLTKL